MPSLARIDHLVLTVRDIGQTRAFYRLLGPVPEEFAGADGSRRWALMGAGFKINLHPAEAPFAPHAEHPVPGSADLCFETEDPLEAWQSALGARILAGPVVRTGARGPMRSLYLRDPDGNLIEICRYDR